MSLSASDVKAGASGKAVVAWVTHGTPCCVGLCFNDAMAEQVIQLMQVLLGNVAMEHEPA